MAYEWLDETGAIVATGGVVELPRGIGQHRITVRGRDPRGADGSDSVLIIVADTVAPLAALSVSGGRQRTLTVDATDLVGVVSVVIEVDGVPLGAPLTAAPYVMTWDTTTASGGGHTVQARARDAAGNQGFSAPVKVWVDTPPTLPPVPIAVVAPDLLDPQPVVRLESITCSDGCRMGSDVVGGTLRSDDRSFSLRAKWLGSGSGGSTP